MSQQLDRTLEEIDLSMSTLRAAMRGVPAGREGFRGLHDRMARTVAELSVAMADARSLIRGG